MNASTELAPTNTSRNNAVHQDTNVHSDDLLLVDWKFVINGETLKQQTCSRKQAKPTEIPSTCI